MAALRSSSLIAPPPAPGPKVVEDAGEGDAALAFDGLRAGGSVFAGLAALGAACGVLGAADFDADDDASSDCERVLGGGGGGGGVCGEDAGELGGVAQACRSRIVAGSKPRSALAGAEVFMAVGA